ncbi:RelB antitoxin/Antitoxin DinJ family toxin (plasmid) [Zymomonas mobilis subsp. mobilis ZM4 = ATCC 31821]|uniref:Addiction module antitoxin, RelB/DinJ family n=2 Tax=Zymomonas mobilis TaxID=542 RepID=D3G2D2_ZYMMO|nr:type II toxin-antitoxin system RelB/DinJ family antitoxin [Zymomonas mobilis]AAF23802.1 negative regulator of translation [Zymomonas mobilis subsp. mobilis ZM4 = ATCC 31821]AAL36104.1 unknown [Zymomonas mobilis subsp. mobilis ZM4 = ATCC 31821]ACV76412.1 addiction module antitoxin, RelB/DinJ family [Zymomonas mobilis subsp. mobilis NCIMB 11163]ADC33882.1 addiction module antitoxin, RelB/DinJ family [Zymomonas mobilis subsp. mobilis ZM4 = ATCC 31821]AHB11117.1 addiction module antitoxin, RelB
MATTSFNLRLDQDLRDRAFPVLERYGLSAAQAFKLFLNQVAETKTIPLSFDYAKDEPNMTTQKAMLEALRRTDFSEAFTAAETLKVLQENHDA